MALTTTEYSSSRNFFLVQGTADGNSDTFTYALQFPMRSFTCMGRRAASGNFTFTVGVSADGITFSTQATCTVTGGTVNAQYIVDKPSRFIQITFSDAGSATIEFKVLGVP